MREHEFGGHPPRRILRSSGRWAAKEERMIRSAVRVAIFAVLMLATVPAASADDVTWTLTGLTFVGGGTATGSFTYDATTDTVTSIDIVTTGGPSGTVTYTALDPGYGPYAFDMAFVPAPSLSDYVGQPALELQFQDSTGGLESLTNAGGVVIVDVNEFVCTNAVCSTADEVRGTLDGGTVVGVPTPEPSALSLLAIGLLGLLAVAGRKILRAQPA